MPVPATNGQLQTNILGMKIGDYIPCRALTSASLTASNIYKLGESVTNEVPLNGYDFSVTGQSGAFYFIKVDKGLLIADRVVYNKISWDALNTAKMIEGMPWGIGTIRCLSGGVAFTDATGFVTFPANNEWDRYILSFPANKIQIGKSIDDVFHHLAIYSWAQETPTTAIAPSTNRVFRKNNFAWGVSSALSVTVGFRPVLEYREV